jgi:anti-sigma regulatory factor (Ser/Thr protein kinase)
MSTESSDNPQRQGTSHGYAKAQRPSLTPGGQKPSSGWGGCPVMALMTTAPRFKTRTSRQQPDVMLVWFERQQDPSSASVHGLDARRVGQMRRLVEARLLLCRLPELVDPMLLVTSELVTNALQHGEGPGVSLLLASYTTHARLCVRDGSHATPRLLAPSVSAESGRGLFLVEATARELGGTWGTSSDHTQTWCELPWPCQYLGHPGSLDAGCARAEPSSDSTSSIGVVRRSRASILPTTEGA